MSARFEISKSLILINTASSVVATGLNVSVLVWLQQYLLKRISPEEYSLLPVLMSVMAFSPLLTTILTGGLGRYITVAYAKGDDDEVTRICSTMFPILCTVGFILFASGMTFAWYVDKILTISRAYVFDARIMMALLVFSVAIRLPLAPFGSGLIIRQRLVLENTINVGCQFLRITVLFLLLFGVSTRVLWVVAATVGADLVALAISQPISMRLVPAQRFRISSIHWSLAKELIGYGGWTLVCQAADTIKTALDPIVLNKFASPVDVACFHVGSLASRQISTALGPFSRPLIPVVAGLWATGDITRLRATYLRTARYYTWLALLIAIPGVIFSSEFMRLYVGDRYSDSGKVMATLLTVAVVFSLNGLTTGIAGATGAVKSLALRQICMHVANLILTFWLVAYLKQGATGSALATLIAIVVFEPLLMWPFAWRLTHTRLPMWLAEIVVPTLLPTVPAVAVSLILKYGRTVQSWFDLFAYSGIAAAVYAVVLFTAGLRPQDRQDILQAVRKVPYRPLQRLLQGIQL